MIRISHVQKQLIGIILSALLLMTACSIPTQTPDTTEPSYTEEPAETAEASFTPEPTETPSPEPTEAPTPEPTEAPTPEPTVEPVTDESLQEGMLDAFFDDSVLIGDSLTVGFSGYINGIREREGACLGTMEFVGKSALFLEKAYNIEIGKRAAELEYHGHSYSISDLVQVTGARTVYLLFGVNDIYNNPVEDNIMFYREIVDRIWEKSPDVRIVLTTVPPVIASYASHFGYSADYNKMLNDALRIFCAERDIGLVELAERVRTENGYLEPTYCSDEKLHLNNKGRERWLEALREYARSCYESGLWTIPEPTEEP